MSQINVEPAAIGTDTEIKKSVVTVPSSQIPTPVSDIKHTTSAEGILSFIYRHPVKVGEYTVSVKSQPGQKILVKAIHPMNSTGPMKQVAVMFNTWSGGEINSFRVNANSGIGGSIRVAFVPPNYKRQQIMSMTSESLSLLQTQEIIPNSQVWLDVKTSDERNVFYHYMDQLDEQNPDTFAGWLIIYMDAGITTFADGSDTFTILHYCQPQYVLTQPNPEFVMKGAVSVLTMNEATKSNILGHSLPDDMRSGPLCIYVMEDYANHISMPYLYTLVGDDPWLYGIGSTISANMKALRERNKLRQSSGQIIMRSWNPGGAGGNRVQILDSPDYIGLSLSMKPSLVYYWSGSDDIVADVTGFELTIEPGVANVSYMQNLTGTTPVAADQTTPFTTEESYNNYDFKKTILNDIRDIDNSGIDSTLKIGLVPTEQTVMFCSANFCTFAYQTDELALFAQRYMLSGERPTKDECFICALVGEDTGSIIAWMRWCPDGTFTTNLKYTTVLRPTEPVDLQVLYKTPLTSPIPESTLSMKQYVATMGRFNDHIDRLREQRKKVVTIKYTGKDGAETTRDKVVYPLVTELMDELKPRYAKLWPTMTKARRQDIFDRAIDGKLDYYFN